MSDRIDSVKSTIKNHPAETIIFATVAATLFAAWIYKKKVQKKEARAVIPQQQIMNNVWRVTKKQIHRHRRPRYRIRYLT